MNTSPTPKNVPPPVQSLVAVLVIAIVTAYAFVARSTISPTPPVPVKTPPPVATSCGVTKTAHGYTFDWLHVKNGRVVNQNNCPVPLYGWNSVGAFLGTGGATGDGTGTPLLSGTVVRVAYNERWYVDNVYVPNQKMHYQQWLQQVVKTEESRGYYVILDADTAFYEPPCGNDGMGTDITFCPSEDQGRLDYKNKNSPYYQNTTDLEMSQPVALESLVALAQVYSHDPAVLFDVWNEPAAYIFVTPVSVETREAEMNERINTVRKYAPSAPVLVYSQGDTENLSYSQPNLLFDFHIYPNFHGVSPVTGTSCATGSPIFSHVTEHMDALTKVGRAIFIGEWGHCNDLAPYNAQMLQLAETYHAGMAYFTYDDLVSGAKGATKHLNGNGMLVQQDYTTLFVQK